MMLFTKNKRLMRTLKKIRKHKGRKAAMEFADNNGLGAFERKVQRGWDRS